MKRSGQDTATVVANGESEAGRRDKTNGNSVLVAEPSAADLGAILACLQTMRDGDFSVRLPGSWVGLPGKIADTFNSIVAANQWVCLNFIGRFRWRSFAKAGLSHNQQLVS
jgi:hypothetical protein